MANTMYAKGRQGFLDGTIDWDSDDIRAILVDTGQYTVNLAVHDNLNDIIAGSRVAVSGALTGKTATDGIADAADVTFAAVTGATVEAIVIYQHTGVESSARLIAFVDTAGGLPLTPNGFDVQIQWDNGSNKIFKL